MLQESIEKVEIYHGIDLIMERCGTQLDERPDSAIDTEMFQEILYRYGSIQRWDIAIKMADSLFDLVPIIFPVIPEDARLAIRLFGQYAPLGIPARDLIHVAVMQSNQISHLISTDQHFDRIEGVTRHDPTNWVGKLER